MAVGKRVRSGTESAEPRSGKRVAAQDGTVAPDPIEDHPRRADRAERTASLSRDETDSTEWGDAVEAEDPVRSTPAIEAQTSVEPEPLVAEGPAAGGPGRAALVRS